MLRSRPFRTLARTLTSRGTAPGFVNIARPCDASDITVRKVYIASCKLSAPNHGRITNFVTTEYANVCNAHVVVAHVSPQGSVHSQMACLCDVPSNGIGKYGVLRHLRKQFKSTHNRRVLFEAKRATNLADLSSLQRLFSGVVGGGALDPHGFSYHRELHVVDFIILRFICWYSSRDTREIFGGKSGGSSRFRIGEKVNNESILSEEIFVSSSYASRRCALGIRIYPCKS